MFPMTIRRCRRRGRSFADQHNRVGGVFFVYFLFGGGFHEASARCARCGKRGARGQSRPKNIERSRSKDRQRRPELPPRS